MIKKTNTSSIWSHSILSFRTVNSFCLFYSDTLQNSLVGRGLGTFWKLKKNKKGRNPVLNGCWGKWNKILCHLTLIVGLVCWCERCLSSRSLMSYVSDSFPPSPEKKKDFLNAYQEYLTATLNLLSCCWLFRATNIFRQRLPFSECAE